MKTILLSLGLLIIVLFAFHLGTSWKGRQIDTTAATSTASVITDADETNMGTYQYECDEHVNMSLTFGGDMETIHIDPNGTSYPPAATLVRKDATTGVRYEGEGVVMTAHGETVTLGLGDSSINCSPVPSSDSAPFNFGD